MIGLIRSEFLKLRSTQVWFWLLLACARDHLAGRWSANIATDNNDRVAHVARHVSTAANSAYIASFVLGVLSVTTEFRYQTITPTVLATPSRWRLITAKLITLRVGRRRLRARLRRHRVRDRGALGRGPRRRLLFAGQLHAGLAAFTVVSLFALIGLGIGALLRTRSSRYRSGCSSC